MHLIHIYWLAVQVPSRLLYMVLSCLGMYSTVFMPYARICGAFSLPFACYSCGHLLMLYWQIRFLLSSHFWNLKNQWRYYILCLWYELNCCLKVLASGFLHSSPVYPGGFLLSFSGFVTCSSYNCSPKVVQETHWLCRRNYNGSVSNLSAFFFTGNISLVLTLFQLNLPILIYCSWGLQAWLIWYLLTANSLHLPLRIHSSVFMHGEFDLLFFILLLTWTNSMNLILISNENYCISLASCNSRPALEMS
jgi:hypothetical protein